MQLSLHEFLIRHPGTLRVIKLPKFAELSNPEQLMLDLLAHRFAAAKEKVGKLEKESEWVQFCRRVASNGLANLISERLVRFKEAEPSVTWAYVNETTARIQRLRISESLQAASFDHSMKRVLNELGSLRDQITWIKGSSLRSTIYGAPEQRFCSDFDLVVRKEAIYPVITALSEAGYQFIKGYPAFCNQLGLGPVSQIADLLCVPSEQLVTRALGSMSHVTHPAIDLKLTPLDRGLALVEEERFWADTAVVPYLDERFRAPSNIDHLILCSENYVKDGFCSWKSLYDVHLLSSSLKAADWVELVRRCLVEGVSTDLWASLCHSSEMLSTPVPNDVLQELQPRDRLLLRKTVHFTVNYEFSWNANSFFGLLLNALSADDLTRKMAVLRQSLFPPSSFITAYYCFGNQRLQHSMLLARFIHFWILFFPAILTRMTFGKLLWDSQQQYTEFPHLRQPDNIENAAHRQH